MNISNNGEDAYDATFYMPIPNGIRFQNIEQIAYTDLSNVSCTVNENTLHCDIGNPLHSLQSANFSLILMPIEEQTETLVYSFIMKVNSIDLELNSTSFDNVVHKNITINVDTQFRLKGNTGRNIHYQITHYKQLENATKERDIGPPTVNWFEITNNGTSSIEEAEVFVVIQHQTNAGNSLIYLLNQPETLGNIKCESTNMANTKKLKLDDKRVRQFFQNG